MVVDVSILEVINSDDKENSIYRDILSWHVTKFLNAIKEKEIPFTVNLKHKPISSDESQALTKLSAENLSKYAYTLFDVMRDTSSFKFTEIGNWLIENHRPFKEEYAGSRIAKSYRLHSKRNYIQARIENMLKMELVLAGGNIKSLKNQSETTLYQISLPGLITALTVLLVDRKTDKVLKLRASSVLFIVWSYTVLNMKLKRVLYQLLIHLIWDLNPVKSLLFYKNLTPWLLHSAFNNDYNSLIDMFLIINAYDSSIYDTLVNILQFYRRSDEKERFKLISFEIKEYVESSYSSSQSSFVNKEWEILRLSNASKYSEITIMCWCDKCEKKYPLSVDLFRFLGLTRMRDDGMVSYQKLDCLVCKSRSSLAVLGFH